PGAARGAREPPAGREPVSSGGLAAPGAGGGQLMESVLVTLIKSLVLIIVLLTVFAYLTVLERKTLGYFQLRVGPNRVGPWGLLQPLADGVKALFKEDIIPAGADPWVFR